MKAIILERRGEYVAALREDGIVVRLRRDGEVGETIELATEIVSMPARRGWARHAVAAALAVAVLGGSAAYLTVPASAYVSLDAGDAAIELSVNRIGRVVNVSAIGGAEDLAESLRAETRGRRVEDALTLALGRMDALGYVGHAEGLVIAGVTADSASRSEQLNSALDHAVTQSGAEGVELYTADLSPTERREAIDQQLSPGRWAYETRRPPEEHPPEASPAPQTEAPADAPRRPEESPDSLLAPPEEGAQTPPGGRTDPPPQPEGEENAPPEAPQESEHMPMQQAPSVPEAAPPSEEGDAPQEDRRPPQNETAPPQGESAPPQGGEDPQESGETPDSPPGDGNPSPAPDPSPPQDRGQGPDQAPPDSPGPGPGEGSPPSGDAGWAQGGPGGPGA